MTSSNSPANVNTWGFVLWILFKKEKNASGNDILKQDNKDIWTSGFGSTGTHYEIPLLKKSIWKFLTQA